MTETTKSAHDLMEEYKNDLYLYILNTNVLPALLHEWKRMKEAFETVCKTADLRDQVNTELRKVNAELYKVNAELRKTLANAEHKASVLQSMVDLFRGPWSRSR
jgi:hypothetical protein